MTPPVQLVETSFTRPAESHTKTAPKRKVTLVVWTAIFPTVLVLSTLLSLLPLEMPRVLSVFVVTAIAVPTAVYILVPRLYRLFAPWVYRGSRTANAREAPAPSSSDQEKVEHA